MRVFEVCLVLFFQETQTDTASSATHVRIYNKIKLYKYKSDSARPTQSGYLAKSHRVIQQSVLKDIFLVLFSPSLPDVYTLVTGPADLLQTYSR